MDVVNAMRAGAWDFISIPHDPAELVKSVRQAMKVARAATEAQHRDAAIRANASRLTPREREIVRWVAAGLRNKEIAEKLGLAEVTVKVHRSKDIRKLGAGNPAEMARLAAIAGLFK